jgi:hypothetical protein
MPAWAEDTMAADHGTIGDDFGAFLKVSEEVADLRDAASGTVTIDAVETTRDAFIALFNTDAEHKFILEAIKNWINSYRAALNGVIASLWSGPVALWLGEYVRGQVDSTADSVQDIVRDWAEAMLNDGKNVEELTVAVVGPTADPDNSGDGTMTVIALEPFEARPNEILHNEKYTVRCRTDSFFKGAVPGSETFFATADLHRGGVEIKVKHAEGFESNRVVNGGCENYGNDVVGLPDSWDLVTGTAGTDITQETGAGDFIRGTAALGIDGDGVAAEISIEQPEAKMAGYSTSRRLRPLKFYQIAAQIRTNRDAGIAAGDSFFIEFQGTGYVPTAADRIEIVGPDAAAYREEKATMQMPATVPADMVLAIRYNGTPAAGATVLVDDLTVAEFTIWEDAGLGFVITRGPTADWRAGDQQDYFTLSTTNTEDKRFQRWLIRITDETTADVRTFPGINRMLPSGAVASAEYLESKAT